MTPSSPLPCRILIGPLMRPFLLGDWISHPDIRSFTFPAGVERYFGQVLAPGVEKISPHTLQLEFCPQLSLADIWRQLPVGWQPDLLIWWGFFFGLPVDIAECPVPSLLVVSDWHTCLGAVLDYVPLFDHVCCDKALQRLLLDQGFTHCSNWPGYGWDPAPVTPSDGPRDLDISFIGNLNPALYRERNSLLQRLARLAGGHQLFVGQRMYHHDYTRVLQRSKIVFNQGLRGEMNMRAYEAAACGALLMMEADNLEIRDFLTDRESCVLYEADNLFELVEYYLSHDAERERIATNGQHQIQAFSFEQQFTRLLKRLPELLKQLDRTQRQSLSATQARLLQARHLSRIFLPETLEQAVTVLKPVLPDPGSDPISLHALAICQAHQAQTAGDRPGLERAARLLQDLLVRQASHPEWAPSPIPLLNLAWIHWWRQEIALVPGLLQQAMTWLCRPDFAPESLKSHADFVLPLGFCTFALEWERQPQRCPQDQLWPERRKLLIWNGLLLQGQLSSRSAPAKTLPFFAAACDLCPELPDPWLARGQLELTLGQPNLALAHLHTGLACGGIFPWVYLALIPLELKAGNYSEAQSLLNAAKALFNGPGTESIRQQLSQLQIQLAEPTSEGFTT
ncbi:MAG TPA: glycosyltransferase [Candidatus Obscuribacterales bacterium]